MCANPDEDSEDYRMLSRYDIFGMSVQWSWTESSVLFGEVGVEETCVEGVMSLDGFWRPES